MGGNSVRRVCVSMITMLKRRTGDRSPQVNILEFIDQE
jgi:hypothetical protein